MGEVAGIGVAETVVRLEAALLAVDRQEAARVLAEAGTQLLPLQIVDQVVTPALEHVGKAWEQGLSALSQVYMSGRICEDLVRDLLPPEDPAPSPDVPLGIVTLEDRHSLGRSMVAVALRANGLHPVDLGCAGVGEVVARVQALRLEILLISTLMLPSALKIREVRSRLEQAGWPLRIAVGGAPFRFDRELWREVGADACGQNACDAIAIARSWLAQGRQARPEVPP